MTKSGLEDYENWRLIMQDRTGTIPDVIKYKLMHGYPLISVSDDNEARATEKYIIRARDWEIFLNICFPPTTDNVDPYSFISKPNRAMPGTEDKKYRFVTRTVTCEPFPSDFPADPYISDPESPIGSADEKTYTDYLVVTIEYEAEKEQVDSNDPSTFLELSADAGGEYITIQRPGQWVNSASPGPDGIASNINNPFTVIRPQMEWNVRWPKMSRTTLRTVMNRARLFMGKVNNDEMPLFLDAEIDTILFVGFSFREDLTWHDDTVERPPVEMNFKFIEKSVVVGRITWVNAEGRELREEEYDYGDFYYKYYLHYVETLAEEAGATELKKEVDVYGHQHFYRPETGKWEILYHIYPRNRSKAYSYANLNFLWENGKVDHIDDYNQDL